MQNDTLAGRPAAGLNDTPVNLETPRLTLRRLTLDDAPFIVALLNEPDFIRFIGDRKVRTIDEARAYLTAGTFASYQRHGFGMLLVEEKTSGTPVGLCGLVKRDFLEDVDLGFAFLEPYRRSGYGFESATEILRHAREDLGLARVVAIVSVDNEASTRLLHKLGLEISGPIQTPGEEEILNLFEPKA